MHAVLVTVDIEADRSDEAATHLHGVVVPTVKAQPGFVRGAWMRAGDGSSGRGVLFFETEEQAGAAARAAEERQQPDSPARLRSVEIFEVVAEA